MRTSIVVGALTLILVLAIFAQVTYADDSSSAWRDRRISQRNQWSRDRRSRIEEMRRERSQRLAEMRRGGSSGAERRREREAWRENIRLENESWRLEREAWRENIRLEREETRANREDRDVEERRVRNRQDRAYPYSRPGSGYERPPMPPSPPSWGGPPPTVPPPAPGQPGLSKHNQLRALHGVPPQTWSPDVAASAQVLANKLAREGCALVHSDTPYGENLAVGHASIDRAIQKWYDEIDLYDHAGGDFSTDTGHYTQVVWKDSVGLGCASADCRGSRWAGQKVYVCQYCEFSAFESVREGRLFLARRGFREAFLGKRTDP